MKAASQAPALPTRTEEPPQVAADDGMPRHIRMLFSVLHGRYGAKFTDGFKLGQNGSNGTDKGITNAQKVWAGALARFSPETVYDGLQRALALPACVDWPPSLNRIEAECVAIQGAERKPPPVKDSMIGVSDEALRQMSVKAREEALAKLEALKKGADTAQAEMGLPGLFQVVAQAVALAGGDEVRALRYASGVLKGKP